MDSTTKSIPEPVSETSLGAWSPKGPCACCLYLITACSPLVLVVAGDSADDRYRVIVERNAFGLQAPVPSSETPASQPPADLPQLRLTGIYAQGDLTRVFLVKEPRGQEPESLSLAKGEVHDGIELVTANARNGSARLRLAGVELEISFHGQRAAETAAQVAEEKFVEDHTKAHEEQQLRLQEQLAKEATTEAPTTTTRQ